jgi:hypothetical protein
MLSNRIDQLILDKLLLGVDLLLRNLRIDGVGQHLSLVKILLILSVISARELTLEHMELALNIEVSRPCIVSKGVAK